jgi:hypothetical protein
LKALAWYFLSPDMLGARSQKPGWVPAQFELGIERFGMAYQLLSAYAFVRPETVENRSHPTFQHVLQLP